MMRCAALLASVMLVAGSAGCGARTNSSDGPTEPPQDASLPDATLDSSSGYYEAAVADSHPAADQSAAVDSAFDASLSMDAAEGPDSSSDALLSEAGDAGDAGDASEAGGASDAGEHPLPCDQCRRADQQCAPLPQVCTHNEAGAILSCASPGTVILTCVTGDAGCAAWAQASACRSGVPCCTTCMHEFNCPIGSLGDPCEQDTDCASDACDAINRVCTSDQCGDRRQDGQESDVDCGGLYCNSCSVGRRCQGNFDCQSGHLCGSSHLCE